jgi:hypothetical protein
VTNGWQSKVDKATLLPINKEERREKAPRLPSIQILVKARTKDDDDDDMGFYFC